MRRARMNHDEISWGVKRLKSYPLIRNKYLSQLRRVEYFFEYTELRILNEEELNALYLESPEKLTASKIWSYIRGFGLSYGYQWILARNWNLEASAGLGYAKMNYDKYQRQKCGFFIGKEQNNYWGITNLSVSIVYILK